MSMSKKTKPDSKQLRAIGHKLKPLVTVAGNGLSENVVAELERALSDHELIKVKLAVGGKDARTTSKFNKVGISAAADPSSEFTISS